MVNQYVLIGIAVGVSSIVTGVGVTYAIFATMPDYDTMQFQNQQLFNQMMSQNPKMAQQWLGSMMQNDEFMHEMVETMSEKGMIPESMRDPSEMMMGASPVEEHEMILEMMETMIENEDLMNHMFAHMMEDEKVIHKMLTIMSEAPHLKDHMAAHVSGELSKYAHLDEEEHEEHIHDEGH